MANELLTIIRQNLENLDTNDLVEIWKKYDREEWQSVALVLVKEILLERLGNLPEQNLNVRYELKINEIKQLIERSDLATALKECEEAITMDPRQADAFYLRGLIFQKEGNAEGALSDFRRCAMLDFANSDNRNKLQDLIYDLEWDLDNGFEDSDVKHHLDSAWELMIDRDETTALQELELASQDFPALAEAWNYKGMILEGLDRLDEAVACYLEAVRLDPYFWNGRENLGNARKKCIDQLYHLPPEQFIDGESGEIVIVPRLADKSLFSAVEVEKELPGWFTLNECAWLVRGSPGHRNRPGRSGYDPIDYYADEGRFKGYLIRKLFTGRLRTHNLAYLMLMLVAGGFFTLPLIGLFQAGMIDVFTGVLLVLYSPYWLTGLACIYNFIASLMSKKPFTEEKNGSAFF